MRSEGEKRKAEDTLYGNCSGEHEGSRVEEEDTLDRVQWINKTYCDDR